MKNPLVSIIIPVYNAELTIERCLRSIELQSLQNIEVLAVNDGSEDHSAEIINKYVCKNDKFHLIDRSNTGVASSRNVAIKAAKGRYLQFVDADDWICPDATERLVKQAQKENCDMVICDFYRVIGHKIYKTGSIKEEGFISRDTYCQYMMEAPANFYYGVMWNKLYRTSIMRKNQLGCAEDLNWCEDFQLNLEYLRYVKTVGVVKQPLYYYVKTKGSLVDTQPSLSRTISIKRKLFNYYKELYKSSDLYEENRLRIQMFYLSYAHDDKGIKVKTAGKEDGKVAKTIKKSLKTVSKPVKSEKTGRKKSKEDGKKPIKGK